MGTWSEEFINVRRGVLDRGMDLTTWLRAEAARHDEPTPVPGKIVYFPPGPLVLPLMRGERLTLPESMELMFAPGARLIVIGESATLEIRGTFTAPIGPVFTTREEALVTNTLADIALTSPRLERVHPEWWGAGRLRARRVEDLSRDEALAIARVDTAALQAAIRVAMSGSSSERPPTAGAAAPVRRNRVVLELLGAYLLDRPLRVFGPAALAASGPTATSRSADAPTATLEIQGRACDPEGFTLRGVDSLHFRLAPDSTEGTTLLTVDDVASLSMRHVTFEAPYARVSCVSVVAASDPRLAARFPHEFRHCRFRVRSAEPSKPMDRALVRVQVPFDPYAATNATPAATQSVVPAVQFEGCVFDARAPLGAAVQLWAAREVCGADFRGCTFVGRALAMIDAVAFDVSVTGCRFENRMVPPRIWTGAAVTPETFDKLHGGRPEGGVDIFLGQIAPDNRQERAELKRLNENIEQNLRQGALDRESGIASIERAPGLLVVTLSWFSAGAYGVPLIVVPKSPIPGPMGSVTAQDCRSTSPQFLVTAVPAPDTPPMRDATIIGLHHHYPHEEFGAATAVRPPAIQWRAFRRPQPAASLVLVGCRFDGTWTETIPCILADQGEPGQPSVYDYGIVLGDAAEPININNDMGRGGGTPGVLSPLVLGVVPAAPRG